jgi:hypothetical protein
MELKESPGAAASGATTNISNIPPLLKNGKPIDTEALIERAAIIQFDGGLSRYHAELRTAELYGLTPEQRATIFPLPCRRGFEAVLFMAARGFGFVPWDGREGRPTVKWAGENRRNFTSDPEKLRAWSGAGYKRFMYLPGMSSFIGLDIGIGFYKVLETMAGKPVERLPSYLRDLPHSFPCYGRTPQGGLHLLLRYDGTCGVTNLSAGKHGVGIKHLNSGLLLGETIDGACALYGDPADAPDLPPFLAELVDQRPKPAPNLRYRQENTARVIP